MDADISYYVLCMVLFDRFIIYVCMCARLWVWDQCDTPAVTPKRQINRQNSTVTKRISKRFKLSR